MHNVTDRQTDRQTDDANTRSYCVAVQSAKNQFVEHRGVKTKYRGTVVGMA